MSERKCKRTSRRGRVPCRIQSYVRLCWNGTTRSPPENKRYRLASVLSGRDGSSRVRKDLKQDLSKFEDCEIMLKNCTQIANEYFLTVLSWVRRVSNDDVEFILMIPHEFESIPNMKCQLRAVESLCHERKKLLRHLDDLGVDLALQYLLDGRVFGHFPSHSAIPSSYDEHGSWIRMHR
jgi:hypothetical protein